jgi:hypothetical protein
VTDGIGYRERVYMYCWGVRESDRFLLICADTGGNEDCRFEKCVIFERWVGLFFNNLREIGCWSNGSY